MLGGDNLSKYLDAFGFGQKKTGVDLPGEAKGHPVQYRRLGGCWNSRRRVSARAFPSRRFSWSRLSARSSMAGRCTSHISPRRSCIRQTKDPIVEVKPNAVRQVISEDTSFKMRYALESVVALGGAKGRISTATRSAARPEPPRRRRTVRI